MMTQNKEQITMFVFAAHGIIGKLINLVIESWTGNLLMIH